MGRNPEQDEREGKTNDLELRKYALGLRRRGLGPLQIAEWIGVSTATVLRWHARLDGRDDNLPVAPPAKPKPNLPVAPPAEPKPRDLVAAHRKEQIKRGAGKTVPQLVQATHKRYAHQHALQAAVKGVKEPPRILAAVYSGPSATRREGGEILPKQVPWVQDF
jgi:hypothetical protein